MSTQLIFDGDKLRQRRLAQGLTVTALARRVNTHRKTVWLAERGLASVWRTFDLANILGLTPEEIVRRVRKPRTDKGMNRPRAHGRRVITQEMALKMNCPFPEPEDDL